MRLSRHRAVLFRQKAPPFALSRKVGVAPVAIDYQGVLAFGFGVAKIHAMLAGQWLNFIQEDLPGTRAKTAAAGVGPDDFAASRFEVEHHEAILAEISELAWATLLQAVRKLEKA